MRRYAAPLYLLKSVPADDAGPGLSHTCARHEQFRQRFGRIALLYVFGAICDFVSDFISEAPLTDFA